MPKIEITVDQEVFLPVYQHLLDSKNDIEFLYGSRDSGKSRDIAQRLILKCLSDDYFLCPMIRKVANTVKDSQWQMLKSIIEEWGLDPYFDFITHPLEVRCKNGNKFLARGMDDPKKIKSLTNPSCAWIEEGSDLDTEDWVLILTSLRSNHGRTQTWVSFNPDMPTDYEDTFIYTTFFKGHSELSFSDSLVVDTTAGKAEIKYRCTHSTYQDNPYCPPERVFHYENLKNISEYEYLVYAKGLWGKRKTGGEFYNAFNMSQHVKYVPLDIDKIIHVSLDYNVLPYVAISLIYLHKDDLGIWQIEIFKEMPCREPINSAKRAGEHLVGWLKTINYNQTIYTYGDRSTKNRNGIDDDKRSFYDIFIEPLKRNGFKVEDKMAKFAPSVSALGEFVNGIFEGSQKFAQISVNADCKTIINDYIESKKDKDGSMLKKRITDPKTGISYEPNGHFCDNLKDFIYQAFTKEFEAFQNRFNPIKPGGVMQVQRTPKITF